MLLETGQGNCRSSPRNDAMDSIYIKLLTEEQTRPSSAGCLEMIVVPLIAEVVLWGDGQSSLDSVF